MLGNKINDLTIDAKALSYSYQEAGATQYVFRQLDISIGTGEVVALLGASGSGKSTLLNLLGGIDIPDTGQVLINGQNIQQMREPQLTLFRREQIGFVYQLFNLIPTLTVEENIALPLELNGVGYKQRKQLSQQWLGKVGLQGRERTFPDQLSGGEQQRVAIARALIHQPALVLADEPTGNLDAETGQMILQLLLEISSENNQTLIIVTHSHDVAKACDRVMSIQEGKLVEGYQVAIG